MEIDTKMKINKILKGYIAQYQDFPKPGIIFKDLNPIYADANAFSLLLDYMEEQVKKMGGFDLILGVEARGFISGAALANRLGCGFVPLRKKGKLPGDISSQEYDLEYGTDCLEVQPMEALKGARVLIVDDVFATGGTLKASIELIKQLASYVACGIVLDIKIADINTLGADYFVVMEDS
jgi:adenine phosphoribosyltransferase